MSNHSEKPQIVMTPEIVGAVLAMYAATDPDIDLDSFLEAPHSLIAHQEVFLALARGVTFSGVLGIAKRFVAEISTDVGPEDAEWISQIYEFLDGVGLGRVEINGVVIDLAGPETRAEEQLITDLVEARWSRFDHDAEAIHPAVRCLRDLASHAAFSARHELAHPNLFAHGVARFTAHWHKAGHDAQRIVDAIRALQPTAKPKATKRAPRRAA